MTVEEKFDHAIAELQAKIDSLTAQLVELTQRRNKLQRLSLRVASLPVDEKEALLAVLDKIT